MQISNALHSSVVVLSLRRAANATCAFKPRLCVRRVRRADFLAIKNAFLPAPHRAGLTPRVSTYQAVQFRGATFVFTYSQAVQWPMTVFSTPYLRSRGCCHMPTAL